MNKYLYFIAFTIEGSFGNYYVLMDSKVKTPDDVKLMESKAAEWLNANGIFGIVVINNYIFMDEWIPT